MLRYVWCFFFFQAEDGIRDYKVTGVQTCALPILADLSPVGRLLADANVEKILHDADYDLRILDRDYGFRARRLFDTRIAAQLAGEPAVGLAALLGKDARGKLAKEHQKADLAPRPPSP